MRKTETIKIDDREIVIKELRVKDIRKILEATEKESEDVLNQIESLLPLATDLKLKDMEDMAPSELKTLWEAFREVNADFLSLIERLGIQVFRPNEALRMTQSSFLTPLDPLRFRHGLLRRGCERPT